MRRVGRLLPCCLFWLVAGSRRVRLFSVAFALAGVDVVGLGGGWVGRGGAWSAGQGPVGGLCRRLHGRRRVCGASQCGRAVLERVVEVVVPHRFCLPDPGLCQPRCVWTAWGSLSPVVCRVEGFPRGALAACEGGGLEESLPASRGDFRVYFWGVGLGSHEDSVCPLEEPPMGVGVDRCGRV